MTAMPSATTRFPYIKMLMVFALLVTVVSAESTEAVRSSPAFNTSTLTSNSTSAKPYLRSDAVMATSDDASSLSERAFITLGAQLLASSKSALANQIRQLLEQLAKTPAGDAMIKGYLFRWALEGRTSAEVFELLGLDMSGENFLNNLLASTWSRYVTSRGFNDPTAVMLKTVAETMDDKSLLLRAVARAHDQDNELVTRLREAEFERLQAEHKTLEGVENELFEPTRHYDEEDLAKFLVAVKDVDSTKPLVTRLVQDLAHKGKTSAEVFKLLELDKSGENFLNNPLLSVWSRYVTFCGFDDPTAVMIKTVSETIKDKSLILRAVIQARDQDSELLIRLRDKAFERLLAEHKTLEGVENELFKPTRRYDDQDLAKFLVGVKDVDSTKPLMTRLEQEWALKRKTSTEVFKLLGLHESGENFLNNPLLSLWSRYVTSSGSNDPTAVMIKTVTETIDKSLLLKAVIQARDQDSELVIKLRNAAFERLEAELLKPTRHYDEEDLAKLLVAVKDVDSTKLLVTRLEQELAHKGKTSTEVFKLLELDKSGENFLNNPLLSVWSRYVTFCGFDDPTAVMIETVIEAINDKSLRLRAVIQARDQDSELVTSLRNAEFERLLAEETPKKVEEELSKFTDEAGKKALYRFQKFYGKRKAEPISKGDASRKNNGIHIN